MTNFKVIIAGGGPAGLVAAHSLHLAGIDFIVLEQRNEVVIDVGASLVLRPESLRVFHQFGILDRLNEIGNELQYMSAFAVDGHQYGESTALHWMKDNHGSGPVVFHRAQLIEAIYDGLPTEAKARIQTGKKILAVASDEDGVTVTCTDGSVYEGSLLIGADGVHSRTRRQMRKLALENNSKLTWDPEDPYTSQYKCTWCSFPSITTIGEANTTHSKDRAVMYMSGKTRSWIFMYEKLPYKTQERMSYTEEDAIAFAKSFAEYPIAKDVKVKDVFAKRLTVGMSNLEEGIVHNWSWSRIAIVGDAAHKYTPNGGLGLNNGIQDVVALVNGLVAAVRGAPNGSPSLSALTDVFHQYQDQRLALAEAAWHESHRLTLTHTDANILYAILGHYLQWFNWVQFLKINLITPCTIRKGLVLDYVISEEPMHGALSWIHQMKNSLPLPKLGQ